MNDEWCSIVKWDQLPDVAGVYEIKNVEIGLSYIGSAAGLKQRNHYKLLKLGKSHNPHLQEAFNKYGENAFVVRILDLCPGQDPIPFEQKRLDERGLKTLYNRAPVAGSGLGYRFTKEQREKLSKIKKGVPFSLAARQSAQLKKYERAAKADIYRQLFKEFKKSSEYQTLLNQIVECFENAPGWKQPTSVTFEQRDSLKKSEMVFQWNFQTWWMLGGGGEYTNEKYKFSHCCPVQNASKH